MLSVLGVGLLVTAAAAKNRTRSAIISAAAAGRPYWLGQVSHMLANGLSEDGINFDVLPFASTALDSIQASYTPISVPSGGNATRMDVHGTIIWSWRPRSPTYSAPSACDTTVVLQHRALNRARAHTKLDLRDAV